MTKQNNTLSFVFPGQGSQSVSMLSDLGKTFPLVKETFEQASDILSFDLWKLVQEGPIEALNQTHRTQPAMLAAGVSVWRVWCENSEVRPGWMAGHSLGEYTALVCSNTISFTDGIALVSERGRLMQAAVPVGVGAMAAILGLADHQLIEVCANSAENEVVAAVNFNAPGQVVIAGHASAVDRAMKAAKDVGAKRTIKLPVSVPSHCALMTSAAEKLAIKLQEIKITPPKIKLIHNVSAATHNASQTIPQLLKEQLYQPVRWVESIQSMYNQGVSTFLECGPGKILLGLNKRIAKDAKHMNIADTATFNQVLEQINE